MKTSVALILAVLFTIIGYLIVDNLIVSVSVWKFLLVEAVIVGLNELYIFVIRQTHIIS